METYLKVEWDKGIMRYFSKLMIFQKTAKDEEFSRELESEK